MRKLLPLVLVAAGATALFAWTVLERNGNGEDAGSPMAFAPADTPFAMGLVEPLPGDVMDAWVDRMDPVVPVYAAQLRRAAELTTGSDAAAPLIPRLLDALADEIEGKTARAALASFGLAPNSRVAVYGLGLVPVLRWELADVDAFRAFVARMEQAGGQPLATGSVGGQAYWRLPVPEAPLEGIAAVVGTHLVLTVAPATAEPAALEALLGLRAPDPSVLDSDTPAALADMFGYHPSFVGFFDSGRFVTALTSAPTPLEQSFLAALDTSKPEYSEVCREELKQLALAWPRASFGYTALDATHMGMRAVLETTPEIAADLMTLRAPMPALGAIGDDTLFNLGVSLNLDALPALVNKRTAAMASQPWACESLAWLNTGAASARTGINNPALYAAAPVFRGFHAILETLELGPDMKPIAFGGALVIGSANPQSLLAMAATAVPQVATLDLEPDGSVQPLDLGAMPNLPASVPAWISMGEQVLGVGFGDGADARLPGYMQADAARQPLLVVGYSGRLYGIIADIMQRAAAELPDPAARAEMERQAVLMREVYAAWIEHADMRIEFTEHGIEMLQDMDVRD